MSDSNFIVTNKKVAGLKMYGQGRHYHGPERTGNYEVGGVGEGHRGS